MSIESQSEHEFEDLERRNAEGLLTPDEYNKEMRQLQRAECEAYEEERDEAHRQVDRDLGYW